MKKYMTWILLAAVAVALYWWWKKKRLAAIAPASAAPSGTGGTNTTTRAQPTFQLSGAGNANQRPSPGQMVIVNPAAYVKKNVPKPVVQDRYVAPGFKAGGSIGASLQ